MAGRSRTIVRRTANATPQIDARTPTVAAIVAVTERGPIGTPYLSDQEKDPITSWAQWQEVYGAYTANAQDGPNAAKGFFDEGGQLLYTSRVVHCTTPGDPTTKTSAAATFTISTETVAASAAFVLGTNVEPFALANADAFEIAIDESPGPGTTATATISATSASRDSAAGPFALVDGQTLTATINGIAVTFTFTTSAFVAIGAATAAEVAAVLNAKLASLNPSARASASVQAGAVRLETTWLGTGASLDITGGTANAVLLFTTGAINGGGNVADVEAVTAAEIETIFEAANAACDVTSVAGAVRVASLTTGANSSAQITATGSTAAAVAALGFDTAIHQGGAAGTAPTLKIDGKWDGSYANALSIRITAPRSGLAARFDMAVLREGRVVEQWTDLSMDEASPFFVETIVNAGGVGQRRSALIKVTDLDAAYPSPDDLPAIATHGPLAGGDDGLAGLTDVDFYGSQTTNGATGLYALNIVNRIDVIAIPGRATAAVHNQLVTWITIYRDGNTFGVMAVPSGYTVAQARTYVLDTAQLYDLSEIAAIYGPWIAIDNPLPSIFGTAATIVVPPEGAIMGVYARTDRSKIGGAFVHPSNAMGRLTTARGVELDDYEDNAKRDLAFDALINPIRRERGKPIYIDGARTLRANNAAFPTVGQSRGAMLVANNLIAAYEDERNAPITSDLFRRLTSTAEAYLDRITKAGALRSRRPEEAFFVDFGPGLNDAATAEARTVKGTIGLGAPAPAEYIEIELTPFSGSAAAFEAEVAAASANGLL